MDAAEFLVHGFAYLHEALREDIEQMDPEWLFWQPRPELNHAGFLFWHIVRDEDQVIGHVRGLPEVWRSEGWHSRFGMDESEQGTGFDPTALDAFRYDLREFMGYAEAVWARTETEVGKVTDADLQRPAWDGDWSVERLLNEGCLGHGWLHLGEIRYVKGLRGWRFRE